jgi:hypothetical protein
MGKRKGTAAEQEIRDRCNSINRMIRRAWCKDASRREALTAARRNYKGENKRQLYEYQCAECKLWHKATAVQVDHVQPIGSFLELTAEAMGRFLHRLFMGKLQILCKPCHVVKSTNEKQTGAYK